VPTGNEKNPRRVAAGRKNRQFRGAISPAGIERLRQTALKNRPWLKSTGPRTAAGKARLAESVSKRRRLPDTDRVLKAELESAGRLLREMAELRQSLMRVRFA
jgi:hypothetical protein